MNRKSVLRKRRKDLIRWSNGTFKEYVLNLDEDDEIIPDRKEWGYHVEATVNGWRICAPDRNRWEAIYAAWDCAKWCLNRPPQKSVADMSTEEIVERVVEGVRNAT